MADKLIERTSDIVFFSKMIAGNIFLDCNRRNFIELATAIRPCVQVSDTDNFVQDLDHAGFATVLMVERFLADDHSTRVRYQISAQLTGDLEQDLAVAFLFALVVDVACLLYGNNMPIRVVFEQCETRAAE